VVGAVIGAVIAGIAIYMERSRAWTAFESITFFAVAVTAVTVPYQWFYWRTSRFSQLVPTEKASMKRPTYLALGLAVLCWLIFAASFLLPYESTRTYRFMGFFLGAFVSAPTLLLCGYYFYFHGVRTKALLAASVLAGVYALIFITFIALLYAQSPVAHKVLTNAF
jgi:hypothetical protein